MPLSLDDFIKQVGEEIDFRYNSYSRSQESKGWAFAQWALELHFPSVDSDEAFSLLASDTTWNVSATYCDTESGIFYLLYAHYSDSPKEAKFGPGVVYSALDLYQSIKTRSAEFRTLATGIGDAARAFEEGYELAVIMVIFGELDPLVELAPMLAKYGVDSRFFVCHDLHSLRRIYAGSEVESNGGTIVLRFLSCADYQGPVHALVGNVAATELKRSVGELVPHIYDANLRVPLGLTKINKQMKQTLSSEGRRFFWYYNNGITLLCRGFQPVEADHLCFEVESPRIVNGAQTTDTILSADIDDSSSVAVMVRLIAALPDSKQVSEDIAGQPALLEDLYLDIAKYTNSQNPIEVPDFRSNEEVQRRLHKQFESLGWFYEHRRGQWENCLNKSMYRGKHIQMVELAQRWFSFDGHPAIAIREKLSLFEEEGHYGSIFLLGRSAEEYLVAYLIFGEIQERLSERIKSAKDEERTLLQSDGKVKITTKNYLMIGRATKLAASHMSALIGRALRDRYGSLNQELARENAGQY